MKITGHYQEPAPAEINVYDFLTANLMEITEFLTGKKLPIEFKNVNAADNSQIQGIEQRSIAAFYKRTAVYEDFGKISFFFYRLNTNASGLKESLKARDNAERLFFLWMILFHEMRHAVQVFNFKSDQRKMFRIADLKRLSENAPRTAGLIEEEFRRRPETKYRDRRMEFDAIFAAYCAIAVLGRSWDGHTFNLPWCSEIIKMDRGEFMDEVADNMPHFTGLRRPLPVYSFSYEHDPKVEMIFPKKA